MLSPQALIRGLVQRALPSSPNPDGPNVDVAFRQAPYGEMFNQPLVRKGHNLADEGSYFTASSAAGIVPTYGTSMVATSPFALVYNGNAAGGYRVGIDYLALTAIVAGACTTTTGYTAFAAVVDTGNRYTSGGTALTPVNSNLAFGGTGNVSAYAGAITATAASSNARTVVNLRNLRPGVSTTVINVVGDMNLINFGSVEGATGSIVVANANIMPQALPPITIPPNASALFYLWYPVMSAPSAATYAPEIGFWVR